MLTRVDRLVQPGAVGEPSGGVKNRRWWALFAIVMAALVLRVWAVSWGWPYGLYGDEVNYAPNAMRMAADRTLDTGRFHNSHLFTYVCLAEIGALFLVGYVTGVFQSVAAFGTFAWSHANVILSLARLTTVVFGVMTVIGVYLAGRQVRSKRVGAFSALVLAVSPLHVYYSKVAVNDVPMTAFVVLTLLATLQYLRTGRPRWLYVAACTAGLAAGTKYNGGLAIVMPIGAAVMTAWGARADRRTWRAAAITTGAISTIALTSFLLANPFAVLSFDEFVKGFRFQAALAGGRWPNQPEGPVLWLMIQSAIAGLGVIPCLMAVAGAALLVRQHPATGLAVCGFPAVYVGVMALSQLFFPRFLLPVYPALALMAGYALSDATLAVQRHATWGRVAAATIVALALALPFRASVQLNTVLWRTDTRLQAREWLRAHSAPHDRVLADFDAAAALDPSAAPPLQIRLTSSHRNALAREWTCERIAREGIRFVLLSSAFTHAGSERDSQQLLNCVQRARALEVDLSPLRPGATAPEATLSDISDVLRVLPARVRGGPRIHVFEMPVR